MLDNLLLVHHKKTKKQPVFNDLGSKWLGWETCLRAIGFSHGAMIKNDSEIPEGAELYQGPNAYSFALEVICGLHSPMVGETEVYGQFKELLDKAYTHSHYKPLVQWLEMLNSDAKQVRRLYLKNLGSFSYGSVLRRKCRDYNELHFIGAGSFVKELLPWVTKTEKNITIYARNPDRAKKQLADFADRIHIKALSKDLKITSGCVVICAPIKAKTITPIFDGEHISVIDLRGESRHDALNSKLSIYSLDEMFNEIELTQKTAKNKIQSAKKMIQQLALEKNNMMLHRPYGWHDIA
ncbi:MAG: hypothetical protein MK008_10715 [Bdellovibrionales bacterium]|nr:hypothetical protein [Bdellovibrionales bacterium]